MGLKSTAKHLNKGFNSELYVIDYLKKNKNLRLISHRLKTPYAELDLVMKNDQQNIYYVIEVKTIKSQSYLEQSIHPEQIQRIRRAASHLISRYQVKVELWLCLVYPGPQIKILENIF